MTSAIQSVNCIVAGGSVDGMAGTTAFMRHIGNRNIAPIFTLPAQVKSIDPSQWAPNSKVAFIGLAVNNDPSGPQLTIDFVKKIYAAGHTILVIADEHGKQAWNGVLDACGHGANELAIKPKDREKYSSTCSILSKKLEESIDAHTRELLDAGIQGDKMVFDTRFGKIFHEATGSNIQDNKRREYVVKHMVDHETPDGTIQSWMNEYAEMEANQSKILNAPQDLRDGITLYDCTVGRHNATSIFNVAYKKSPFAVLINTNVFFKGKMQMGASIGTDKKDFDVLKIVKQAGIDAYGFTAKANFELKDLGAAVEAIRKAISANQV